MKEIVKIIRLSSVLQTASKICHQHGIEKYVANIGGYRWQIIKLPNKAVNNFDLCIDYKFKYVNHYNKNNEHHKIYNVRYSTM